MDPYATGFFHLKMSIKINFEQFFGICAALNIYDIMNMNVFKKICKIKRDTLLIAQLRMKVLRCKQGPIVSVHYALNSHYFNHDQSKVSIFFT